MRMGIVNEIFRMSLDSIRSHKLRSFLTLLGIVIGVMTVISMVSIIQGLNKSFLAELESAGSDIIIVSKFQPGIQVGHLSEEDRQRKDLTFEDIEAIRKNCDLVKAVAVNLVADFFESIPIKYQNNKSSDSMIMGMNDQFPEVLSVYLPERGRFLTESDMEHSTKVCVLGYDLKDILFPHSDPLGKDIRVGPEKFRVVGVLQKRGSIFGQSRDNFVGLPLTTFMKYFPYDEANFEFIISPKKHDAIPETIDQVINLLRQRRKVPFNKPNDFAVFTQDSIIDLYNQLTGAAYLVMVIISSIGLFVGGIGVMNIMLVSVKERTREIGIRKAIGARSGDILKQFLIEAVVLTGTGGIIGVLVGYGIAALVKAATPLPATVTLWSVALGLGVAVSVGLFFGIFPAQKAARMDPIEALRYE
ncbi:MAG: ABC transporter permease [Acidobacteria bacterium]|nr:ABC transporter permease [Acidobacteriota bacterium]MBU4329666.1 ABC transporter permease [Acidobacteriota bacterium]MBU4494324.1 ABC transporter permease [Acidobacteriota bacterium]